MNLPAQTKRFCLNAKRFTEIFMVPKQTAIIHESFNNSLKSTWVKKYLYNDNHGKWKLFFDYELHDFGGVLMFKGNSTKIIWQSLYIYQTPLQQKF